MRAVQRNMWAKHVPEKKGSSAPARFPGHGDLQLDTTWAGKSLAGEPATVANWSKPCSPRSSSKGRFPCTEDIVGHSLKHTYQLSAAKQTSRYVIKNNELANALRSGTSGSGP